MADAMVEESSGLCSQRDGDCGSWMAIPYFISFLLIGSFVFLNLVVAVILQNFSSIGSQDPALVRRVTRHASDPPQRLPKTCGRLRSGRQPLLGPATCRPAPCAECAYCLTSS